MDSVVINLPPPPSRFNLPNSFYQRSLSSHKPKTFGVSSITANLQNPYLQCGNHTSNRKPFLLLLPILKNLEDFASKASKSNWISPALQGGAGGTSGTPGEEFSESLLQSGGFGMALLSITATAGVKISPFVATLAANPTFLSGLLAWFVAQSTKVLLNYCVERKWDFRIMCASGGMPSSHSALCTALTASVALCHGVADSLFPVCLGFSLIVMYDAIGVRRHAGMQAQIRNWVTSRTRKWNSEWGCKAATLLNEEGVLNLIVEDLFKWHPISQRKLKELLGHTPSQVIAGAVLGVLVACICCQACSIAI
nr:Acid phosphatase/vanadium-dependent haloperoxidase-related protein [Ipomoea batatas]